MSTPSFIKYLTDLSVVILGTDNKLETLKSELRQLNLKLPATVYIPFVADSIRNNIVLNIPPKEAKVFVTKTKAPYLINLELYDPLEIIHEPLVLEPYQNEDYLPAPAMIPRILKKKKTLKQIMPNLNILVLGTLPRNVVDLKLLEKKEDKKQDDEDEIITIARSEMKKSGRGDSRTNRYRNNKKKLSGPINVRRQQSGIMNVPRLLKNSSAERSCKNLPSLTSKHSGETSTNKKELDISIEPVLVVNNDVVIFKDEW